ncbi:uncharacterized protein LOC123353061 isoform X2 [Mauremys mutica]|uniref:uncharacterized protein LOC123353061 isoform X2 n=1 Tax=Mauremys mutica TaxID=74926 RepID=UPI001D16EFEA|nr:uncharacterized protein LOC123353061 isoform X2 [Mauremys mutica]
MVPDQLCLQGRKGPHFQRLLISVIRNSVSSAAEGCIQEDDSRCCAGRGIVQEPYSEERLSEVDLITLNILLSRHEQSSAFSLLHNWLTKRKEVTCQSLLSSHNGKRARVTRPRALLMRCKSRPSVSGTATTPCEISVWFGGCSAHGPPPGRDTPLARAGFVRKGS